jgi:hypothetical protein
MHYQERFSGELFDEESPSRCPTQKMQRLFDTHLRRDLL